ncbi:MAG: hypothetical protein GQ475_04755 [Methylococcaceae bacterium]|nr:hypothetical protein [Methylococcaceae bacterium]
MKNYLLSLVFLCLVSCGVKQPPNYQLLDTGKPALHAIQGERLKRVMNELNDLMFERMLNEVQIDQQRRYRTKEIVKVTETLLETVKYIPEALQTLNLDKNEQQIFLNMSEKLNKQVSLLKQDAERNHVDAISSRVDYIIETCNACHHIFRQYNAQ